jgi:hypothetical protein
MADTDLLERQAERSLQRLRPRLDARFAPFASSAPDEWGAFVHRLEANLPRLFPLL